MDHDELVRVANDLYSNEMSYVKWRLQIQKHVVSKVSPHDYALEMVNFWSDGDLGEEAVTLDADDRDIVINLIERKAKEEMG